MSKLLANIQCEPNKLQGPTSLLCYSSLNCVNKKPKKTNILFFVLSTTDIIYTRVSWPTFRKRKKLVMNFFIESS